MLISVANTFMGPDTVKLHDLKNPMSDARFLTLSLIQAKL